ncbi:ROK family protein [Lentisphaerota bacterium WC36G]|nr:ROK family protein [Lentisphaerae bacterium WC36]
MDLRQFIYNKIREYNRISRSELAKKYKLRQASVTEVSREMIRDGIIVEGDVAASTGGRKPVFLEVNGEAFFVVAVEVSKSFMTAKVYTSEMKSVYSCQCEIDAAIDNDSFSRQLISLINDVMYDSDVPRQNFAAIGVGMSGTVDNDTGIFKGVPNLQNVYNIDLKRELEKNFGLLVVLEHDVAAILTAECAFRGIPSNDNTGVIFIDEGIGSAFNLNGAIYRGSYNGAGEFGHVSIDHDGRECYCGRKGCLEQYASTANLCKDAKVKSFDEFVNEYSSGNKQVIEIFDNSAKVILSIIDNVCSLLDLKKLIICGEFAKADDIFREFAGKQDFKYRFSFNSAECEAKNSTEIIFSNDAERSGIYGPGVLAARETFTQLGIERYV